MWLKLVALFLTLTWDARSEAGCSSNSKFWPIKNGCIQELNNYCQIVCNYGFITSGNHVFHCEDDPPSCVKTMAFIIGK